MLQNVNHERGLSKIFLDVNKCSMHQNSENIGTNQVYYQLPLMPVFDCPFSVKMISMEKLGPRFLIKD